MPTIFLDTTDTGENITRSIITNIMNDVVVIAKLPKDKIQYVGELGQTLANGTAIGNDDDVTFSKGNLLRVTATEEYDENGLYTSSMTSENHLDLFTDTSLGIRLKPLYSSYKASIEFTMRAQSKSEAVAYRNNIRKLVEMDQVQYQHTPTYRVPLPELALVTLYRLHQMREKVEGLGEDLGEYLSRCGSPKLTTISNSAGKNVTFALEEAQTQVLGVFEFDFPPKETANGEGSTWESTFTYTVTYNKPNGFKLMYPVSIHNQLIPKDMRPATNLNYSLPDDTTVMSKLMNAMIANNGGPVKVGGWRSPTFDDWEIPSPLRNVSPCLQMLTQVDMDDRGLVMALDDMGVYSLSDNIVKYLIAADSRIFQYGYCALTIQLYVNGNIHDTSSLIMVDGSIYSLTDLDPTKQYHLVIGAITDLSAISEPALDLLRAHPDACKEILLSLEPRLEEAGLLPTVVGGLITTHSLMAAIRYIKSTSPHYKTDGFVNRMRVGYLTIKTGA